MLLKLLLQFSQHQIGSATTWKQRHYYPGIIKRSERYHNNNLNDLLQGQILFKDKSLKILGKYYTKYPLFELRRLCFEVDGKRSKETRIFLQALMSNEMFKTSKGGKCSSILENETCRKAWKQLSRAFAPIFRFFRAQTIEMKLLLHLSTHNWSAFVLENSTKSALKF